MKFSLIIALTVAAVSYGTPCSLTRTWCLHLSPQTMLLPLTRFKGRDGPYTVVPTKFQLIGSQEQMILRGPTNSQRNTMELTKFKLALSADEIGTRKMIMQFGTMVGEGNG